MQRHKRSLTLYGTKYVYNDIEIDIIENGYSTYIIDSTDKVAKNYLTLSAPFPVGYTKRGVRVIDNNIERAVVINFLSPPNKTEALIEKFKQYCGEYKKWTIINM